VQFLSIKCVQQTVHVKFLNYSSKLLILSKIRYCGIMIRTYRVT